MRGRPCCLSAQSGSVRRGRLRPTRPVGPGSTCAEWLCLCSPVRLAWSGSACAARFARWAFPVQPVQSGSVRRGRLRPVRPLGPGLACAEGLCLCKAQPGPAQSGSIPAQPGSVPTPPCLTQTNSAQFGPTRVCSDPVRPGDVPSSMARPGCGGRPRRRSRPLPDSRVGWGCNEKADLPKGKSALFRFPKALTRSAE